jgi:hypothetical protein
MNTARVFTGAADRAPFGLAQPFGLSGNSEPGPISISVVIVAHIVVVGNAPLARTLVN